jgi:mRNA-degrading endonuclease RelE of RelBE toxin-antitoxin system
MTKISIEFLRHQDGFHARLDIKKLGRAKNHYRIRVGDDRIMFVLDRLNALVYDVSHRSNVYKKSL